MVFTPLEEDAGSVSVQTTLQGASTSQETRVLLNDEDDLALCCLNRDNAFRALCIRIVDSTAFRIVVTAATLVHTLLLAVLQPHADQSTDFATVVAWGEIGITYALIALTLICFAADGMLLHRRSYLRRNVWNALDSLSLVVCALQLVGSWRFSPWIRCARMPRAIRLFVDHPSVERVVRCLRRALPLLVLNLVLVVYVMGIFSIVAVKSWQEDLDRKCYSQEGGGNHHLLFTPFDWPCGDGFTCADMIDMYPAAAAPGTNVTCTMDLHVYSRETFNFDNLATALLIMLRVASLDNLEQPMVDVMTISGKPFVLFYVVLIILTSFLCVYLFLAILVDAFVADRQEKQLGDSLSLSTPLPAQSMASLLIRDAATQVCEADETQHPRPNEPTTRPSDELTRGTPMLLTLVEGSFLQRGKWLERSPTPKHQESKTASMSDFSEEMPAWQRPIPLPFLDSVRRRGFWTTICELECTTSRPSVTGRWRMVAVRLLISKAMVVASLSISVANTACLCALYEGMPSWTRDALINTTIGTTFALSVPLIIKVVVFGWFYTMADAWNVVDLLAVATAAFEVCDRELFESYSLLQGLRTFRMLRVGKLLSPLERFTRTVFKSWTHIAQLVLCLVAFVLWFAIVGMVLFGESYTSVVNNPLPNRIFDQRMHRDSFGTLWESMLLCFVILSGDRWTTRLQIAMQQDEAKSTASVIFFLAVYLVGNFLLINLFVVLLTESTAQTLNEEAAVAEIEHPPNLLLPLYRAGNHNSLARRSSLHDRTKKANNASGKHAFLDDIAERSSEGSVIDARWVRWLLSFESFKAVGKSFFVFSPSGDIRSACLVILGSTLFRMLMVCAVVANVVLLLFESSYNTNSEQSILSFGYLGLLILFWVEIIMKMIAFGVYWPEPEKDPTAVRPHMPAFFRDHWNTLDFFINSLCLAAQIYTPLRAAVALRTFRLASLTEYTRRILGAMIESLPQVINAMLVALYFSLILGVLGVQLFGGRFYQCTDHSITLQTECAGSWIQPTGALWNSSNVTREWVRSELHFDSFPSALLSLLVVATGGYWTNIMYDGMDVGEPHQGMRQNQYPLYCLYFVGAHILINVFSLKLAIAILINFFSSTTKQRDGSLLLTTEQQQYVKARDTVEALISNRSSDLVPLRYGISHTVHRLLTYSKRKWTSEPIFDVIVRVVVLLNSLVIVTVHRNAYDFEPLLRDIVDLVGFVVFVAEAVLRNVAYGPRQYISITWNVVDALMLPMILSGFLFDDTKPISFFRAVVLLKLLKHTRLEELLWYIVKNIAYYVNVLVLLFLVFFVYAAAGVITFGNTMNVLPGTNELFNFRNVPSALLVLFMSSTGRGWEAIMNSLSVAAIGCVEDGKSQDSCGSQTTAVLYFTTFMILAVFSVLHLLVAVVVEIFRTNLDRQEPTIAAFFELKDVWETSFGSGCSVVHIDDFLELVPQLPVLLTGLTFGRRAAFVRLIASLQIPIDSQHRMQFKDVIRAFVWRRYRIETRSASFIFGEVTSHHQNTKTFTVADALAAQIIQTMYRDHRRREKEAYRNRMLAIRRQMLRRRGTYDDQEESLSQTTVTGEPETHGSSARRHSSSAGKHPNFSQELMSMFASLTSDKPAELTLPQSRGSTLPHGAMYIPDSSVFAFGGAVEDDCVSPTSLSLM